jgi:hypothetical protein
MPLRGARRRMEPESLDLVEEGPVADLEKLRCTHAIPVGLVKRQEDDPTLGRLRSRPGNFFEADPGFPKFPGDLMVIAMRACPTLAGRFEHDFERPHHSLDHLSQLLDAPIPPSVRRASLSGRAFAEAFNTGGDDVPPP